MNTQKINKKNKLTSLLSKLDRREWQRLHDYIASPYFNKRKEVLLLYEYFLSQSEDQAFLNADKISCYRHIFGNAPYDDKQMAYLYNYLVQLIENFLTLEHFEEDTALKYRIKLDALVEKGLEKHYNFHLKKAEKQLQPPIKRRGQFWRDAFRLREVEAQTFIGLGPRQYSESFQRLSYALDDYYCYEKLRYTSAMLNIEGIGAEKYTIRFMDNIIQHVESQEDIDYHLNIFYQIYLCLTQTDNKATYFKLKALILQYKEAFHEDELRDIIRFAINICARNIRKGNTEFYGEALELYLIEIDNKPYEPGDYLSTRTFNNIVTLALRLKRHDWLESFIQSYALQLHPKLRDDSMNYSMAQLAFNREDFDTVLQRINQMKFNDPQYYLGSRVMLIKSFYALDEYDSLSSQLASFVMFLRRNKKISADYKKTFLNFCSLLHLILRSKPGKKDIVLEKIQETKQKIEGPWLLKVATEIL